MALTQVSDAVVPEIFTPYSQNISEQKSRLIQAGALSRSAILDELLRGGGLTFNVPFWKDLADEDDNVSNDADSGDDDSTPFNTSAAAEVAVRLNRNQSWSTADLTEELAGSDPAASIASRVGNYWARRLQAAFIATITGVFADNAAAPTGTEHVQNDLTHNISGMSYTAGVTDFSHYAVQPGQPLLPDLFLD